jgi:hypothetical protein
VPRSARGFSTTIESTVAMLASARATRRPSASQVFGSLSSASREPSASGAIRSASPPSKEGSIATRRIGRRTARPLAGSRQHSPSRSSIEGPAAMLST